MSHYHVESTSEADEHARTIHLWWLEHRPASPTLFFDELTRALALLGAWPLLGRPYHHRAAPDVTRCLVMRAVKCHLYYTVDTARRFLLVRAIWHASRGGSPF